MENQVVRRRVNIIASHLAGSQEEISTAATHLFPMSCSNSLNSIIRRCDNRMYFARQSSASQACFMRQGSNNQETCGRANIPSKSTLCANGEAHACDSPMFSKPVPSQEPKLHNVGKVQRFPHAHNYHQPTADCPIFSRPRMEDHLIHTKQRKQASTKNDSTWLPKMDVAESRSSYVVTLELPGVNVSNVLVEVNDQKLRVTGNRSIVWQKMANNSVNSLSAYHKREISQGPYQIEWPLPTNVNKNNISAELTDGLLVITVPKHSAAR